MISAGSLRLGLFLVFFLAYFGGYPAIQFQERHFFHLEFMGWWAMAFIGHHAVAAAWSLKDRAPDFVRVKRGAMTAGAFALGVGLLFVGVLGAARWYQARQARQLFEAYIAAPKVIVDNPAGPITGIAPTAWPQMLEVDLDEAVCGPKPSVTFRYAALPADTNFTRTITIERRASRAGLTRLFQPVFAPFDGLAVSDPTPGCLVGASRIADLSAFPLLLGVTLSPDWRTLPLHQRLAGWERDALGASVAPPGVSLLTEASPAGAAMVR